MERPGTPAETARNEDGWPSSAVELQRQQRRAKRAVERFALFVIVGPVGLALLAFLIFWAGSGSAWALLGIPFIALAALVALALPFLVPAVFILGAWALYRTYYKKPPAAPAFDPASAARGAAGPAAPRAADIAQLEALRTKLAAQARRRTRFAVPLGLAAALLLYWLMAHDSGSSKSHPVVTFVLLMVIGGGGAWVWAVSGPGGRYRAAFKEKLIPALLAAHGTLRYTPGEKPDLARAVATGFLPGCDDVVVDDGFSGSYRGRPIRLSEAVLSRKSGKNQVTVFQGLYVEITVLNPFLGTTILRDRDGPQPKTGLQRLRLEDPVFERVYATWSTDQVEGRAVLTPAVMERLLVMADGKSFLPPLFLLDGDRMVFALPALLPGALFEPPGLETHDATQQLAALEADFARVFALADAMIDMQTAVRAPRVAPPPASAGHP